MGTVFSWQGPQERALKKALKRWGMFFLLWSYTASWQKASWRMRVPVVLTAAYDMAMPFPTRIPWVTQVCYWFSWYKKFNQQDIKQGSFQDKQTGDAAKLLLCWTKRKIPQAIVFRMTKFSQTLLLLMRFLSEYSQPGSSTIPSPKAASEIVRTTRSSVHVPSSVKREDSVAQRCQGVDNERYCPLDLSWYPPSNAKYVTAVVEELIVRSISKLSDAHLKQPTHVHQTVFTNT